jgi:hypothetical protein
MCCPASSTIIGAKPPTFCGMNSQPSQMKDWPARGQVAKLLEAQLHRIVELLRNVGAERLSQPAPRLGSRVHRQALAGDFQIHR